MLQSLHEWLAHYGFALVGVPALLWVAFLSLRQNALPLASSSFLAELRKRYPHGERARAGEEIDIDCRPTDARPWGRLRARAEERGLELRLQRPVVGWTSAGWRTLIPWRELSGVREKRRGRQMLVLSVVGCPDGALWVDDASALRLARHAGDWWHSPALRRELERSVQSVSRGATAVLLAGVAAFAAWFGAASAGVMTEWPRERAFAKNHVAVPGEVIRSKSDDAAVAYRSAGYAGTVAVTSCAARKLLAGQPRKVYVSATEPSRASLTLPRDPYTSRIPMLILVLFVLPALVAGTAYRAGAVVRRTRVSEPPAGEGARGSRDATRGVWGLPFRELSMAPPALLAVAMLVAAGLAQPGAPCGSESKQLAQLAAFTGCVHCQAFGR